MLSKPLASNSAGCWELLAPQIFHPDFFGGTWSSCPDPVTFTDVECVNIYQDKNAFYKDYDWRREPTLNSREIDGPSGSRVVDVGAMAEWDAADCGWRGGMSSPVASISPSDSPVPFTFLLVAQHKKSYKSLS